MGKVATITAGITPDRETFLKLAAEGDLIPVYETLIADAETPVSIYRRVDSAEGSFLLESVEGGEKWGRYSFIGFAPWRTLVARGDRHTTTDRDGTRHGAGDPVAALQALMNDHRYVNVPGLPRFAGGAVGWFGYDVVRFVERLPDETAPGVDAPDAAWMFPGEVVVFDNLSMRVQLVHLARVFEHASAAAAYDAAVAALARLKDRLRQPPPPAPRAHGKPIEVEANFDQAGFEAAVEGVKEHIRAGDVFQLVLSQRFQARPAPDPLEVYRALRVINPSPYMYHLRFPEATVVGASPELLYRVEGDELTVRPIAGTRPRGAAREADLALEAELKADPKEVAEHVMLIDLGRNDVGRVAELGSVRVVDRMVVERYSHVMHLVSSVVGKLPPGVSAFDAFRSAFPAGTLSGAPKVRAMQLIERFEPVKRSVYGGAVGYFAYNGNADLAIAIRTLVATGDTMTFQAGAGIVYDSVPELEYQETLHKAGAVRRAIELAAAGLPVL